jgi:hypothetical protein
MSFFSNIFKRKKHGSRIGNMLRNFAYKNTYGALGSEVHYGDVVNPDADAD